MTLLYRIRKGSFWLRDNAEEWTYREDEAGLRPEHEARLIAHEVEGEIQHCGYERPKNPARPATNREWA